MDRMGKREKIRRKIKPETEEASQRSEKAEICLQIYVHNEMKKKCVCEVSTIARCDASTISTAWSDD
jgi:hypothetical protein